MADPTPKVVLDRDYVVRAVNPAYCRATVRDRGDLMARYLFDVFPANPEDPDADGVPNALSSFERVLRTGLPDNLLIQRHDIPDPGRPGAFLRRDWMPVHSPLRAGADVVGILVQISDVTLLREDVRTAMQHLRAVLTASEAATEESAAGPEEHRRIVDALTDGIRHFNALADEVGQLREALTTRGVIEQAKGMLMLSRDIGPDEAFDVLRRASQRNRVPLAQVAAVVVRQLTQTPHAASKRSFEHRSRRRSASGNQPPETILTAREKQVLKLIAAGNSSKEIAGTLAISVKTVDRHRANILTKLGLRDQVALVRYAIRTGLVEP